MTPPRIRPITQADHDQWRALWRGYLTYYETELPDSVFDDTFARLLSGDPHGPFGMVADADGTLLGLVHYLFHAHTWHPAGICYLQDLFTTPEARGRGVARALIHAVYDRADAAGVPRVYWTTQDFNATARRLYDQVGTLTPFIKYTRPL
ncbi:GNAT family N-acetyltransferase [Roseicitreum antarcticum]|uniref:Protein N-acetyltransferase, RimJ/RimL family n=1 Tax=Roseicitreum antarcticum TaxID=564137 RepID=A0A1H2TVH8_9RHOB|nr:GNAT family N-acetyltransferase [Roseicitreum antarcticum]SDW47780.1 Protein N-acetyltransferase, RimJ/RimL family [Roseicitreum antarcticum]